VGANVSRPLAGQRMGFLCRHSAHLLVSRILCRTRSGLAARQRRSPVVPRQRINKRTSIGSALCPLPGLFNLQKIRITLLQFRTWPEALRSSPPHTMTKSFLARLLCNIAQAVENPMSQSDLGCRVSSITSVKFFRNISFTGMSYPQCGQC
jgi:hypothetical protein